MTAKADAPACAVCDHPKVRHALVVARCRLCPDVDDLPLADQPWHHVYTAPDSTETDPR